MKLEKFVEAFEKMGRFKKLADNVFIYVINFSILKVVWKHMKNFKMIWLKEMTTYKLK